MKRNKWLLFLGLFILSCFLLAALFPQQIAPYGLKEMGKSWLLPCREHVLGTNDMGYDIFTELIYASKTTLVVGVAAAVISLVIGSFVGVAAGYLPGWTGEVANGFIQIFLLIPMLPMAIVIASFCGNSIQNMIFIIAVLGWCGTAKAVRIRTLQLKQTSFVESLIILGISKWQIMFRHILPNLWEVILSRYIMSVAQCIMLEATLSFLGLGDPLEVTWGRMINLAYKRGGFTRGAYHWLLSPGICIALLVVAFYCINHYLEEKNNQVAGGQSYLE